MKNRFTTLDLIAILPEIREKLCGNRVYQVYDIDNKTFLIRFSHPSNDKTIDEEHLKQMLILESGIRLHLTEYDWPKNPSPSGFTMKLRKHIRNKRLEQIKQIGNDRVVDLQFGTLEYSNHIILELYSKGNIILTDKDYSILSLLRIHKDDKTNINIAVREKYPMNLNTYIATEQSIMTKNRLQQILTESKEQNFKKLFNPHFLYGPNLLEHSLMKIKNTTDTNQIKVTLQDLDWLVMVFDLAESIVQEIRQTQSKGYLTIKIEKRTNSELEDIKINDEFHPYLFRQLENRHYNEYESFNKAVDIFFSSMESQRIESKVVQHEKQAMKKLESIKKDHESRLENLAKLQEIDNHRAALIENNIELVENAISVLRSAIANKYSWDMIAEMVKDAQDNQDPIATKIKGLKLEKNCFSMLLDDPYEDNINSQPMVVDIDIDLTAYANARKYYDHRKDAAKKEQKTLDHTEKIYKNVQRKVKQELKETTIKTTIVMAKKTLWFEKFFWSISSEGFLIIAGRDAQQNEMIVKRYLTKNDLYVHADIHGATSVVIKNHTENMEIPPKTINEAANIAVCYSASWEAKVVSTAYWVYSNQVQKTAPTGQYLSVGSFMIRGKKNYIPLQNLVLGFGILFRIDEQSLENRRNIEQKKSPMTNNNQAKENTKDDDGDDDIDSAFPDTKIEYKNVFDEQNSNKTAADDDDYTIVNTGENLKKKVKMFSQKTAAKQMKKRNKMDKKNLNQNHENVKETNENATETNETKVVETEDNIPNDNDDDNDGDEDEDDKGKEETTTNENNADGENAEDDDDDDDIQEELNKYSLDSKRIISSLISNPTADDNLLYALPVCGPYSAMQSYKYKVKIIPGTTKRGKASKNALMLFLKEKSATDREKDLLKTLKDQEISKNMPAKVKIVGRINK
ncbi:hypothetical protein DERP_002422 [Dermatophagoides pteronyssinus]|uniref:Nuclear export mediator factor NEMF homolog n=1 Tax=Dermatophagoides pteronyssinus TaxID=6956 RepID=A0ABQ8JHP7_DERPT|nr:hypothetical protein DERP_002422 [Dermatophagoides pteronyssinus]